MTPMFAGFIGFWEILLLTLVIAVPLVICGLIIALCTFLRRKKGPPPLKSGSKAP